MRVKQLLLVIIAITCLCSISSAGDFSFTGTFSNVNQVQYFTFTVAAGQKVVIQSYSYAGGANAAGASIQRGGFDPYISLFQGTGTSAPLFKSGDDEFSCQHIGRDPITNVCYDVYWEATAQTPVAGTIGAFEAGTYTVALTDYANFSNGATLGDGFTNTGSGLTCAGNARSVTAGTFADCLGNTRDGHWALDIKGADSAYAGLAKPKLVVTAANATRTYGAGNPILSGTLAGLQPGDSITATYASASDATSPVGSYPIVPTLVDPAGKLANYTVTATNGVLTVNAMPTPAAVSVTPSSGSGTSQLFSFAFSDDAGAAQIKIASVVINSTTNTYANSCTFTYDSGTGLVSLIRDSGSGWVGSIRPGTATSIQNSQCTLNGSGSKIVNAGANLTLTLSINFNTAFSGTRNVYLRAQDASGLSSGWQQRGTWTPVALITQAPTPVSVTPNAGAGTAQLFQFAVSDVNGYRDIKSISALIGKNSSYAEYGASCLVMYDAVANKLSLIRDDGSGWLAAVVLGTVGTVQNSHCSIDAAGSSVNGSGNTLQLNVAISFKAAYAGLKSVYLRSANVSGLDSGWQLKGAWTVQ